MLKYFEILKGILDFLLKKDEKNTYGGAFNDQAIRKEIFAEIIGEITFDKVIETGTYYGNTTEFMYKKSLLPITTIEIDARRFGFSVARLFRFKNVKVCRGNSGEVLKSLLVKKAYHRKSVFIYLDAHRNGPLPLIDEIRVIDTFLDKAVIMIDDFKVPQFPKYGFDSYDSGESLDLAYLSPLNHLGFQYFFPSSDPKTETGKKRGCVVMTADPDYANQLKGISLLNWNPVV